MRRVQLPPAYRRPLLIGCAVFGIGLLVPLMLWLSLPVRHIVQVVPTPTPQIVRVGGTLDEPIPTDWNPPNLNPQLEADVFAIPETLPLTQTNLFSQTLPITDTTFDGAAGLVATEQLNLRDGPGGAYMPLLRLNYNTPLQIIGQHDGWLQVVTEQNVVGWVDDSYIATTAARNSLPLVEDVPDPYPVLTAYIDESINGAHLRSGPSSDTGSLGVMQPASGPLQLLTRFDAWYEVRTPRGTQGWVAADLVQTSAYIERRVPVLTASPQALEAVRLARKYIGYSYVWGGETPRQGFDCSGLVLYVYGNFGIDLPHSAAAQWRTAFGPKITNQRELLPGDVVFFENTYKPGVSHVGIYAGNRLVIQAISEGAGISVSSLDNSYWANRYVGARRPFP